jgi:DNA-binding transcriptional MerR regulator
VSVTPPVKMPHPTNDPVEWTIRDVAEATGLTSRALRHYERIGLLSPSRTASSGYRYYGDRELARLYRILSLRALDLPLAEIQKVLDADGDIAAAMRTHLAQLHERQKHTAAQIAAVHLALSTLEKGTRMPIKNLFASVDSTEHEDEVRQRWGDHAWERSNERRISMSDEQRAEDSDRTVDVNASLRAAAEDGIDPFASQFQALVTEHYAWVTEQWAGRLPTRDAYLGLSQMYVADERFASYYGGTRNAEAIRTAIQHWANAHL